nr:hypothetical protein [Ktedonospora formicarum]
MYKHKIEQEASNSPVSVGKGMNGFKPVVAMAARVTGSYCWPCFPSTHFSHSRIKRGTSQAGGGVMFDPLL